eukprot:9504110-Pyramimonas_sp.AAC.1
MLTLLFLYHTIECKRDTSCAARQLATALCAARQYRDASGSGPIRWTNQEVDQSGGEIGPLTGDMGNR